VFDFDFLHFQIFPYNLILPVLRQPCSSSQEHTSASLLLTHSLGSNSIATICISSAIQAAIAVMHEPMASIPSGRPFPASIRRYVGVPGVALIHTG